MTGLVRREEEVPKLRAHGIVPLVGDLDHFRTLSRLPPSPYAVVHAAPPPGEGRDDPRTQRLLAALTLSGRIPQRFVYISTSGVYGDCAGARIDERRPRRAQTPRARRRVAAEDRLRRWAARHGVALAILRVPGIYAAGRLPIDRVKQGTPVLDAHDDVYTNHIHADDLARAVDRGAVPRPRRTRVQRHRRRRAQDGRVVRRGGRRVQAAATAPRHAGRKRRRASRRCCCRS